MRQRFRAIAFVSLLLLSVTMSPIALAASDDPIAPGVDAQQSWLRGYTVPEDTVTHGATGTPTWIVTVEGNDTSTLNAWTNESENRAFLSADDNTAVVAASPADIGVTRLQGVLNRGLSHKDYTVRISPNRYVSLAEPVSISSIPTAENATAIDVSALQDVATVGKSRPTAGIAYRDSTNVTTVGDARDAIGADNVSQTGDGLTVAVIDTGVNTANGTLGMESRVLNASKDFVESNGSYEDTVANNGIDAVEDGNGHGTWVASAIAADPNSSASDETYEGVAPDADILALRVLGDDGSGSTADIAEAVRYAEAHGADVIAMSLGSQLYTAEVGAAVQEACAGNTTAATIAAGNSRRAGSPYLASPADTPSECVIAVAASNTTTADKAGVASFSQLGADPGTTDVSSGVTRGEEVDLAAPGMLVEAQVATEFGATETRALSGTSMAQPFVAGATLQTLEARSELVNDSAGTRDALTSTARRMPNAATVEAGHGLVAPDRAIAENTTTQSQADAMDDEAAARDAFWRAAGEDSPFSWVTGLIGG